MKVANDLFKEHAYYFDPKRVQKAQVIKLIQMILDQVRASQRKQRIEEERKKSDDPEETEPVAQQASHPNFLEKKGLAKIAEPSENTDELQLEDIETIDDKEIIPMDQPVKSMAENKTEDPVEKFEPEELETPKIEAKVQSKIIEAKSEEKINMEVKDKPNIETSSAKPAFDTKGSDNPKEDGDESESSVIMIDNKKYKEIQIEGEEEEFLMDEEGNIYDRSGKYIGTAKDGGEESEEEDDSGAQL